MRSLKLSVLNAFLYHLMELIILEECNAFRDRYIALVVEVLHVRRKLLQ